MNDQRRGIDWRGFALVAVFGGIGGRAAWVWSITAGTPLDLDASAAVAANVFLGGVAGILGVFFIKLDSPGILTHTLSIALLSGFAWKPTLEAGRELLITRIEESQAEDQIEAAEQSIAALNESDPEMAAIVIDNLASSSTELIRSIDSIRDPALRREADRVLTESVVALNTAAESAPGAAARALGSIGSTAFSLGRTSTSETTTVILGRLADNRNLDVAASAEVSNSLFQLSGAAAALAQMDLAQNLEALSRDAVDDAVRQVQGDTDREVRLQNDPFILRRERESNRATR